MLDVIDINIGVWGYGLAAVAFFLLTLLLLTSWRGRLQGALLVSAVATTVIWAVACAFDAGGERHMPLLLVALVEVARNTAWFAFMGRLLAPQGRLRPLLWLPLGLAALVLATHVYFAFQAGAMGYDPRFLGHVLLAVSGLVLVEQVFRNTPPDQRWAIKYLCFGVGGMFAYDFFLYSDALLFQRIDWAVWDARGVIASLVVPLIAVSAARNPQWSLDVSVSRRVVFHTATLLAAGIYLLAMAGGGYIIHVYGGSWRGVGQAVFLFSAMLVLLVLMFSGHVRARVKVFLSKHFFNYKYDYRTEWLNLIGALSTAELGPQLRERAVQAMAEIVDSPAGMLWWRRDQGGYRVESRWNLPELDVRVADDDTLIHFLAQRQWVIDLDEYRNNPEVYGRLHLPDWVERIPRLWLLVPLAQREEMHGFIALTESRARRQINWEDRDLLKTVGRQTAGYLALAKASEALAHARQFEAFNRLSAYIVHDLKNVVGQLSLVVANAKKFKHNEDFVDDAFATVDNAVAKMNRMLGHLRQNRPAELATKAVRLETIIDEVVKERSAARPVPLWQPTGESMSVVADRDRLAAVIGHVIQNAQEATPADGRIEVRLSYRDGYAALEIEDTGCGMDAEFVRERLFRPFDTTKGNAGMGIGAYECREFLRSMNGDVEVSSTPGMGSNFRLLMPASLVEGEAMWYGVER